MQDTVSEESAKDFALDKQPLELVEREGITYTILGTAHVSKASADAVQELIESGKFDAVAIELDQNRYNSLTNPDSVAQMDLFQVIRQGKAGMVAANLALGAFQQRIAEQFNIEPGQEMRIAIQTAKAANLPILLIDRDIGITLRRVYRNVPWWQRLNIFAGLITSVFSNEKITEDEIEKLKQGDMLESTFAEFAQSSERLFTPLIAERDQYMAAELREQGILTPPKYKHVLAVIGAGHLKGLVNHLKTDQSNPEAIKTSLNQLPPPSIWPKIIPWLIVAVILFGFVIGFRRSPELGLSLIADWFLINGVLAGLGAAIALGHPLTVLGTFIAAPFTSLNPLIGAGFVAAGIELWLRKPHVGDFSSLRKDVTTTRGWWRNRVARTLLVFFLATLGSAAGTYIAGFKIFGRLFG
ncbi:MAG: TraB/GumN family protein [Trueperaceae bacterium]|nr:TraB/GumN family protein [Trueperaceae bacterium]